MSTVSANKAYHSTLIPNVADQISFNQNASTIKVTNRASVGSGNTSNLFVRYDGIDPEVGGDNTLVVLPGEFVLRNAADSSAPEVRVISLSALAYSAELGE